MSKRNVIRKYFYIMVLLIAGSILPGGCGEKEEGHAETEAVKEIVEGGEMVKIPPNSRVNPNIGNSWGKRTY